MTGINRFSDRRIWPKSARIVDFWGTSSGLADFESSVDRGSALIFDADSRIVGLSYGNLAHRSFLNLGRYVNEFIQIISFFERSSFN